MSHTPGPWTIGDDPCVIESPHADNDIEFVAMVLPDSALGWNMTTERESNARLIAAAPELLAALECVHRFLHEEPTARTLQQKMEISGTVRAAIAKAKGVQS